MIYVCSDIHGCADRFFKLLKEINFSGLDHMYILGDIIDRNPDGVELLKYVMDKPNITLLMGNHEHFMYSYLVRLNVLGRLDIRDNFPSDIWLASNNGGAVTLTAFSKEPLSVKKDILYYLSNLPVIVLTTVNGNKFHLSHAGTIPDVLSKNVWCTKDFPKNVLEDVVWNCPYRMDTHIDESEYPEGYTSIIGHVPVQRLYRIGCCCLGTEYTIIHDRNMIDIDSGCALFYREKDNDMETALSCICLDNMKEFYCR